MGLAGALATLGLAASLLGGCTSKAMRPVPGVELVDATALDEEHGLLLFWQRSAAPDERDPDEPGRYYLAKHDKDGPVAWMHALDPAPARYPYPRLRVAGGSMLLTLGTQDSAPESVLRLTGRGEPTPWASTLPLAQTSKVWTVLGDATQVFVFWTAVAAEEGHRASLEIAAFDQQTGKRQWTSVGRVESEVHGPWSARLADGWLMFRDSVSDWQLHRRSDGERSPVVADPNGLCNAGGRWWAQRDDQLLALDLGAEVVQERATIAEFIAPERRHQWSLEHCADHGDEVVLMINDGPGAEGRLVGLAAEVMQARWNMALPWTLAPKLPMEGLTTPTRFGEVAVLSSWSDHCAVDLAQQNLLWCTKLTEHSIAIADGEDTLLVNQLDGSNIQDFVRISGADGEAQAAIRVSGARTCDRYEGRMPLIRGGKIWLASHEDPGAAVGGALQHVVIDARTLRPIERPMLTEQGLVESEPSVIQVLDMMPELDVVFGYTAGEPWPVLRSEHQGRSDEAAPPATITQKPLEHWVFGANPSVKVAPGELPARAHQHMVTMARDRAELPADAPIRMLAWRVVTGTSHYYNYHGEKFVTPWRRVDALAVAEHAGPGGTRWVLIKGEDLDGDQPHVLTRSFNRRPMEHDILKILPLSTGDGWRHETPADPEVHFSGVIDEAAWQAVTNMPRVQKWLL